MLANTSSDFEYLEIGLASPDRIRFWSYGEIEKPETINYRTFKPERKGLFCEKIFGPVKDWECSCGKYRRVRYRGIVCERCGVEVTHSKVRRERMGHIELAAPVTHIWFLKGIPSYMGLLLDMSTRQLEEVIYYDSYIVTSVDDSISGEVALHQIIPVSDYYDIKEKFGNKVQADIGASAIQTVLGNINLEKMVESLRKDLEEVKGQKRLKVTKRLRIVESLYKSGNHPEWMVLEAVPVMPPDLRPMVQLEGGRFATSDLNDLYRRVVNRNNRLKRLMDIGAPEMIVRNEKRMLQEAVDVLISNGKRGRSVTGSNGRPLKSLGNIIEGKQGRFRQNLLGKRVDYSARSVIVVGPHLKFHQCGLPKEMALELFKPFIIRKLVEDGVVTNVKSAKRRIERRDVAVWGVLEDVIKGQPVLLNRAPTLHRLGIQAFEPILVEGSAIQIHPLVCTAFNADFDGDQMAVHVPLSMEAQAECRLLILSTNNILAPSSGRAIVTPTQDMVLGCYFLTVENPEVDPSEEKVFIDIDEANRALAAGVIRIQSAITTYWAGKRIKTTMGRLIFNDVIRTGFQNHEIVMDEFVNEIVGKKQLGELVYQWYITYGNTVTADLVDRMKTIGFKYSTLSGISIAVDDLTIPSKKPEILANAQKDIEKLEASLRSGKVAEQDKKLRSNEIWRDVTQKVSEELSKEMGRLNNVFIMANSGARGNMDQVRQLAGMRGLMSDSQGRTVDIPIRTNFKEGLSLTEYFISAYGARKGLVDTALRTADSGYLTRRLVDVAQDVMVTIEDCGSEEGIEITAITTDVATIVPLSEQLEGRVSMVDVGDIIKAGEIITRAKSKEIEESGVTSVKCRSVFHCVAERGLCQKCYGLDMATAQEINLGEAVGIIAAQSIGEPGTQLTMRTFHTGGVDLRKASRLEYQAPLSGKAIFSESLTLASVKDGSKTVWFSTQPGSILVESKSKKQTTHIPEGSIIAIKPDAEVTKGDTLAEYDPSDKYVLSAAPGVIKIVYRDVDSDGEVFVHDPKETEIVMVAKPIADELVEGTRVNSNSFGTNTVQSGGIIKSIVSVGNGGTKKKIEQFNIEYWPGQAYPFKSGTDLYVKDGSKVKEGDVLFKDRLDAADSAKTQDIVQGLPKVEELFEARKPKDPAVLAEIEGIVDVVQSELIQTIIITSEDGVRKETKIPKDARVLVYAGKKVEIGDQLSSGGIIPHDILATKGVAATQCFLSEEVQKVYRSQGVQINSKHIEVIVRQMTRKVNIVDMGDTTFLLNELIDIRTFNRVNKQHDESDKKPALGERVLLGITRASLNTESFVSASSFQQTASVLTKAAVEGQKDPMLGLKENVIIGKLIPAGTGLNYYKGVGVKYDESVKQTEEILVES